MSALIFVTPYEHAYIDSLGYLAVHTLPGHPSERFQRPSKRHMSRTTPALDVSEAWCRHQWQRVYSWDVWLTVHCCLAPSTSANLYITQKVVTESDDGQSDISDGDDEIERELAEWRVEDESIADRLYALRDIVSPTTRKRIVETWRTSTSYATWGGKLAGNAVWVITTSALLVGLPLALAIENETMMVQQEKEMMAQQQGAQQVRTAHHKQRRGHS